MMKKAGLDKGPHNDITLDVAENVAKDNNEVCKPLVVDIDDKNTGTDVVLTNEQVLDVLRVNVLFRLFLDRFLEMVVIVQVLLLAINWVSLRELIEDNFWTLEIITIISLVVWTGSYIVAKIQWKKRAKASLTHASEINKWAYRAMVTSLFLIMGINLPGFLEPGELSPYFVVLASGTAGGTYLFLSIVVITDLAKPKDATLYLHAIVIPVYVLAVSQAVYSIGFYDHPYITFMINVGIGLFVANYFTLAHVYSYKQFVNSSKLEDVVQLYGISIIPTTGPSATAGLSSFPSTTGN